MYTSSIKKRNQRPKSKKEPSGRRIKSAKRRVIGRITRGKSRERTGRPENSQKIDFYKQTNISTSSKYLTRDQSGLPISSPDTSYNFGATADKRKRIYSAKPMLNDSRRFGRTVKRYPNNNFIKELSPSEKGYGSSYIKFNSQTAPSTDFQKSFYHPYQTMTRISDNFLNIEKPSVAQIATRSTARSTESSLSNFTHVQNSKTSTQLQILNKIRDKQEMAGELQNLKHVD